MLMSTAESQTFDVRRVDLEHLDLSTRTRNCLFRAKITTVGELAARTDADILRIQNAGRKTVKEVREVLGALGLKLHGDARLTAARNLKLIAELQAHTPLVSQRETNRIALESLRPDGRQLNSVPVTTEKFSVLDLMSVDLERLDLSVRTRNCLFRAEIKTIGELTEYTGADILRIQHAGQKTLREVREILGALGLKLQADTTVAARLNPKLIAELQVEPPLKSPPETKAIALESASLDIQCKLSIRLSRCNVSVRARGLFKRKRLTYLGDLVQLSFLDLRKVDNAGRRTLNELADLASSHGFELGTPIIGWCRETAERLEKHFASEHDRERIEASNALLARLGPKPSHLAEELSRIVMALATGRNYSMLLSLWGWDGNEPKTLEAIGDAQSPRLTRERVRQIEARALRQLRSFKFDTPILRSAIAVILKRVPMLEIELRQQLQLADVCSTPFPVASIKCAANVLGINWAFVETTVSGQRIVLRKEDDGQIDRLMQIVRRRTSELGCSNIRGIASALNVGEENICLLRKVLDVTPGIYWLDDDKSWLFLTDAPRNRLFNLSAKVLGVSPRLNVSELRRAVSKSRRLTIAPPQRVLGAFIKAIGLGTVENNIVVADPTKVPTLSPESVEGKFVQVFRKYGNVMHGEELAERCVQEGVNPTTFYIYRLISPVVASLGRGIYCKVGATVAPGVIDEILSRRKSTTRKPDHGWLPNGSLWFGFQISRIVLTSGSVRLLPFVYDLVQGDWAVRLADGELCGDVTCRESFIWSFKKAFAAAGIEPEDFVALEFNKKAREVVVNVGGPDLFETIQQTGKLNAEVTEEA
jgi:DNA-directed RNA polymerase alpha subunit